MLQLEDYSLDDAAKMKGGNDRFDDDIIKQIIHDAATKKLDLIFLTRGLKGFLYDENKKPVSGKLEQIEDRYIIVPTATVQEYERGAATHMFGGIRVEKGAGYWVFPEFRRDVHGQFSSYFLQLRVTTGSLRIRSVDLERYIQENQGINPNPVTANSNPSTLLHTNSIETRKKLKEAEKIRQGRMGMDIQDFIGRLRNGIIDDADEDGFDVFLRLVGQYGLPVYPDGLGPVKEAVETSQVVEAIKKLKSLDRDSSFEEYASDKDIQLWQPIKKFTVWRDEVKAAFAKGDFSEYPWRDHDGNPVRLPTRQSSEAVEATPKTTKSNDGKIENPKKERHCKNETARSELLIAAIDAMESRDGKTPTKHELADYVLGGEFKHSNVNKYCLSANGQELTLQRRTLILSDGSELDKSGIFRWYREVCYPSEN